MMDGWFLSSPHLQLWYLWQFSIRYLLACVAFLLVLDNTNEKDLEKK